ncbi:MFS transporter [Nonomuraea sp. NPDC050643]|uniref:MFS transporter n=1 Tax=Nonomuraea sp. NPDC050643 TaxID=3155660 RepID=UPI00340BFC0E
MHEEIRIHDKRILVRICASGISVLGSQFFVIAIAVIAVQNVGPVGFSLILITRAIPRIALLIFGGVVVDRFGPVRLVAAAEFLSAAISLSLGLLSLITVPKLSLLLLASCCFGVIRAVADPAEGAIAPYVLANEDLPRYQGLLLGVQRSATVVGAAAGGVVIAAGGVAVGFFVDALTFAVSGGAVLGLRHVAASKKGKGADRAGLWKEARAGLQLVWSNRLLRSLTLLALGMEFSLQGPIMVGMPVLCMDRGWGTRAIGALLSCYSVGSIMGSFAIASVGKRLTKVGVAVSIILLPAGSCLAVMGLTFALPMAIASMALIGILSGVVNSLLVPLLQTSCDRAYIGRLMSVATLGVSGLTPLSLAIFGILIEVNGPTSAFVCGACGLGCLALFAFSANRQASGGWNGLK